MTRSCDDQVAQWLAPQERFEQIRERALLSSGKALCDLSYANPHDGPPSGVRAALHDAIDSGRDLDLQYTPYGGATLPRRLIARQLTKTVGATLSWRHVVLTPGAMAALNVLLRSVADDGEVIIPTPCWLDYPLYATNLGHTPRLVPLRGHDFDLDLEAIRGALNERTRAVIISQPSNPTGKLFSAAKLKALGELLDQNGRPLLIADECHRDVLFDTPFESPMRFYDNTCIVYSFGKALSLQGQRTGYIAVSPNMTGADDVALGAERWCRTMGFYAPTALMQRALPALMKIEFDCTAIARNRELAVDAFRSRNLEFAESDATFFLYCAHAENDDFTAVEAMAERDVLVMPSCTFHHAGYFRISLAVDSAQLERALPVMLDIGRQRS